MILLDEIDLMDHLRSLFSIDAKSLAFFMIVILTPQFWIGNLRCSYRFSFINLPLTSSNSCFVTTYFFFNKKNVFDHLVK